MEETLTVVKLALPELLRKSLATSKRHRESQRHASAESRLKRQAVEESFHDSPMDRSRRRHGGEKVSPYQRLSPYGRSRSQRLEANRNLLTAMRLLPKSIHRCRRYPTKFNSGRDIPQVSEMFGDEGDHPELAATLTFQTLQDPLPRSSKALASLSPFISSVLFLCQRTPYLCLPPRKPSALTSPCLEVPTLC